MNKLLKPVVVIAAIALLSIIGINIYAHLNDMRGGPLIKDGWVAYPSGSGKPTFVGATPYNGGVGQWVIGHQNGQDGGANSHVSKTFSCGEDKKKFCSVYVTFAGVKVVQGEKPYITLSKTSKTESKTLDLTKGNFTNGSGFKVSLPDCAAKCSITIGMKGRASNPSIASTIELSRVQAECTNKDMTTKAFLAGPAE